MPINILHISDLHLENFTPEDKEEIKSRFKDPEDPHFEKKFLNFLDNKEYPIDYVIITGDLANKGTAEEYIAVKNFLTQICTKLGLDASKFIICPGNHDVNFIKNKIAFHSNSAKFLEEGNNAPSLNEAYKFHQEKFDDFKNFYDTFYEQKKLLFNPEESLFDITKIQVDGVDVLICAINSCYKESFYEHIGYIDHTSMEKKLDTMDKDLLKIFTSHHIPFAVNTEEKPISNFDSHIQFFCNEFNARIFIFGHQHKSETTEIKRDNCEFKEFCVGSLGKNEAGVQNTFNIMTLSYEQENLNIKKTPFQYIYHEQTFRWELISGSISNTKLPYIKPIPNKKIVAKRIGKDIPPLPKPTFIPSETITFFSEKLAQIVASNKLYSSGHFHWNNHTRTLGLINTYALLTNKDSSKVAKGAVLQLFDEKVKESEYIIGIGQEGIILGSFIACHKNINFSSLPYHSRKKDYSKHENKLDLTGIKKITFVTDVTYTGHSIANILNEEVFRNVEEANLISLFYISKQIKYTPEIFEELNSKLKFFMVCDKIKIDKCEEEIVNCSICENKLEKVYEF